MLRITSLPAPTALRYRTRGLQRPKPCASADAICVPPKALAEAQGFCQRRSAGASFCGTRMATARRQVPDDKFQAPIGICHLSFVICSEGA